MAPPPDSTGDDFPDFDNMTPEEQMAWLESLARRQGARDDEFTTAADLEIPVPEDVEVDEPGYVPFEGSRSGREWAVRHGVPEGASSEMGEVSDEEIAWGDLDEASDVDESADPMRWLETLAAQPGTEAEMPASELSGAAGPSEPWREEAAAEPEFEPQTAAPWEPLDEEAPAQETFEPEPEPGAVPQRGVPLVWESLTEEEEAPEPEQEPFAAEEAPAEAGPPPAPQTAATPREGASGGDELGAVAEWEASLAASDDPLAGADPMTWLESLAKRQGVPDEELTTAADLEVPEPPEDVEIVEPGYVPFSALDILPPDHEVPDEIRAEAERLSTEAEEAELELSEDVLGWLQEIAQEPEQEAAAYLAAADEDGSGHALAGLSDQTIERMQARGELTAEQELAQLESQAERLAETRADGEEAPALRAELPDWLQDLRAAEAAEAPDVSDWLAALADERRGRSEVAEPEPASLEPAAVSESELEAFVEGGLVPAPGEIDALAEALDDEYERLLAGTDSEPGWYTDAVARAASEETIAGEPVLAPGEPVDLPDWLMEAGEEAEAAEDLPDWLAEVEEPPATVEEARDWLSAPAERVEQRPEPSPAPLTRPEIPPAALRRAPLPEGAPYAPFRQRLETAPDDYPVRLDLARSLRAHEALAQSLDQYEVLIEATQLLEDVAGDLQQLVEQYEETPRVHRLLGDTYLRRGQLKDALQAYRAALERL